jgi:hypothetical protein
MTAAEWDARERRRMAAFDLADRCVRAAVVLAVLLWLAWVLAGGCR